MASHSFWSKRFGGAQEVDVAQCAKELAGAASNPAAVPASPALVVKYAVPGASSGKVGRKGFEHFLSLFGVAENALAAAHAGLFAKGTLCEWYHGLLPKDQARALLDKASVGGFLVRLSESQPDSFVVQVQRGGRIRQQLLKRTGAAYTGQLEGDGKGVKFASVQDYIQRTPKLRQAIPSDLAQACAAEVSKNTPAAAAAPAGGGYGLLDDTAGGAGAGGYGMLGGDGGGGGGYGLFSAGGGGGGGGGGDGYGLFDASAGGAGAGGASGYGAFNPDS